MNTNEQVAFDFAKSLNEFVQEQSGRLKAFKDKMLAELESPGEVPVNEVDEPDKDECADDGPDEHETIDEDLGSAADEEDEEEEREKAMKEREAEMETLRNAPLAKLCDRIDAATWGFIEAESTYYMWLPIIRLKSRGYNQDSTELLLDDAIPFVHKLLTLVLRNFEREFELQPTDSPRFYRTDADEGMSYLGELPDSLTMFNAPPLAKKFAKDYDDAN